MFKVRDLTGQKFGLMTVIGLCEKKLWKDGQATFWCQCECGSPPRCVVGSKISGKNGTRSCGCLARKVQDLTGMRFGRLTVAALAPEGLWLRYRQSKGRSGTRVYRTWICTCSCGRIVSRPLCRGELVDGLTKSCGCLRRDIREHHKQRPRRCRRCKKVFNGLVGQIYCTPACRFAVMATRQARRVRECRCCHRLFKGNRTKSYCGQACRFKARLQRHRVICCSECNQVAASKSPLYCSQICRNRAAHRRRTAKEMDIASITRTLQEKLNECKTGTNP